jgi:hypothetical protein
VFRKKIHPISTLAMIMFLSMIVADLFSSINLPLVGNADEIMGAIAWGGVLFFIFRNMSAIKKCDVSIYMDFTFRCYWDNWKHTIGDCKIKYDGWTGYVSI